MNKINKGFWAKDTNAFGSSCYSNYLNLIYYGNPNISNFHVRLFYKL